MPTHFIQEIYMSDQQERKIVFAPGCFDDFEGTQEELDAFMAEVVTMLQSAEVQEQVFMNGNIVAVPHLYNDEDEEDVAAAEVYTEQLAAARKRMLN